MALFTVARCSSGLLGSVLAYSATVANMSARVDSWPLMLPVWVVVVSMFCVSPIGWFGLLGDFVGFGFFGVRLVCRLVRFPIVGLIVLMR